MSQAGQSSTDSMSNADQSSASGGSRGEQQGGTSGQQPDAASMPERIPSDTRPWVLVAAREIRVKLTDRNFLVSTGVTLVLIVGLLGFQAFMASRDSAPEYTVAVTSTDAEALVAESQSVLQAGEDGATVDAVVVDDTAAGEAALKQEAADGGPPGDLQDALAESVRLSALSANAEAAGTSVPDLLVGTELDTEDISGDDGSEQVVQTVAGLLFGLLFYMASLTFGISIANSVVEEKQSRIVEILAAVIPVRSLLAGKVAGNTLLAFGQMALVVGVALIGLSFTEYDQYLPMMTEPLLWYLPFFIAGFVALACM